jgi:NADP-dependent 3-hydroxy acid dehydrogenase YdfG
MRKICLITGATSGIGRSAALIFAKNNFDLIITGRRKNKLDELADTLIARHGCDVLTLTFDITKNDSVQKEFGNLPEKWQKIDVLINNAGLALGLNSIEQGITEDWDLMIDTNIKGLLYVSRIIITMMAEAGKGHIINIGSIAGKETYLNGNVYCATKAAVDAISKAMRIDLLEKGIRVTEVLPGAVETEFSLVRFKGDAEKAKNVYNRFKPLQPEDVAEVIYYVTTLPEHVNINELIIMPTAQANTVHFNKK